MASLLDVGKRLFQQGQQTANPILQAIGVTFKPANLRAMGQNFSQPIQQRYQQWQAKPANQMFNSFVQPRLKSLSASRKAQANLDQQIKTGLMQKGNYMADMGLPTQKWSTLDPFEQKYVINQGINAYGGMSGGLGIGRGGAGLNKNQISYFKSLPQQSRNILGKFAEIVERNPGANRKNIGFTADFAQTIAEEAFGKNKVSNLTNKALKNLIDSSLQTADNYTGRFKLISGLSTESVRKPPKGVGENPIIKNLGLTTETQTPQLSKQAGKLPQITKVSPDLSIPPKSLPVSQTTQTARISSPSNQPFDDIIAEGRKQIGSVKPEVNKPLRQELSDAYTQWVDRYNPIVKASQKAKSVLKTKGATLRPEYDPEYLVRRLTGAGGIADARFRRELKPIIDQIDSLKIPKADLDVYLANKRIVGFGTAGRKIYGADPAKAQQIVNALEAKYGQNIGGVADQLYSYQNKGFQEMIDAGFVSPKNAKIIQQQNPDYAPLKRVMDEVNDYLGLPTRKTMQGSQPIMKIKGSKRQIESPLESIIGNTFSQRAAIEKNRVAKSIIGLQNMADMGFSKVSKAGDDTVTIWNNGQKEYWSVGKDIAEVAKGVNEESMNMVLKILQAPASILRQGATGRNPEFMIPNIIRDQLDAGVTSKHGYIPFIDYVSGLRSMISNDDVYKAWERSGAKIDLGEMSGRKSIAKYFDQAKGKRGLFSWLGNTLDVMGQYSEQPTRVGLFKKAYRKTGNELIAMLESRDATVDFARMGSKMKVANSIIPFLNVGVQGFDKLIRAVKNNPAKVLFNATLYGAAPAAAITAYNLSNHPEEYAEIPQYEKDSNFVLVNGRNENGTVDYVTIPKGNVIPSIANPIQSFMEFAANKSQQTFQEIVTRFTSEILPVIGEGQSLQEVGIKTIGSNLPQAIKPITENLLNKSFYKYDPEKEQTKEIVPYYLQDKPAYKQTYEFTPQMYQKIGAVLDASPLKVKNLMEGYLAGFTKMPAQIIEMLYKSSRGEEISPNDKSLLRRFIKQTYPSSGQKPKKEAEAPGLMERITGKVGAADEFAPLPANEEHLADLYKAALTKVNNYQNRLDQSAQGLTDVKPEDIEEDLTKSVNLLNRIKQQRPEAIFNIELKTYSKEGSASTGDRAKWAHEQLSNAQIADDTSGQEVEFNAMLDKLYENQVMTKSVVGALNETYGLNLTKYNYGDGFRYLGGAGKGKKITIRKSTIKPIRIRAAKITTKALPKLRLAKSKKLKTLASTTRKEKVYKFAAKAPIRIQRYA